MTATMTYVGLDVHARSTHAAAIDVATGELRRARFGGGSEEVVGVAGGAAAAAAWLLRGGPDRVRALPGRRGGLGLRVEVIAPSKTPRAPGDRIKSDRKDAELLARLLLAGQLKVVTVPPPERSRRPGISAVRVSRSRRSDALPPPRLEAAAAARARLPGAESTWTQRHRQWLAGQRFDEPATELAYLDTLAAVDGLVRRKAALDERLSRLALEGEWWPTVARLRCFRGIDTLTAFVLCLEIGDFARFQRPAPARGLARARPLARPVRREPPPGRDHQDRLRLRPPAARRGRLALPARAADRRHPRETASRASPTTSSRSPGAPSTASTASSNASAPRQTRQRHHRRRRPRTRLLPLGRRRGRLTPPTAACSGGRRAERCRHAR